MRQFILVLHSEPKWNSKRSRPSTNYFMLFCRFRCHYEHETTKFFLMHQRLTATHSTDAITDIFFARKFPFHSLNYFLFFFLFALILFAFDFQFSFICYFCFCCDKWISSIFQTALPMSTGRLKWNYKRNVFRSATFANKIHTRISSTNNQADCTIEPHFVAPWICICYNQQYLVTRKTWIFFSFSSRK